MPCARGRFLPLHAFIASGALFFISIVSGDCSRREFYSRYPRTQFRSARRYHCRWVRSRFFDPARMMSLWCIICFYNGEAIICFAYTLSSLSCNALFWHSYRLIFRTSIPMFLEFCVYLTTFCCSIFIESAITRYY